MIFMNILKNKMQSKKTRKILIALNDMIVGKLTNQKINPIVTKTFLL